MYGITLFVRCLMTACSSNENSLKNLPKNVSSSDEKGTALTSAAMADTTTAIASSESDTATCISLQAGSSAYTDWDKKIIKTANLSLEVKDFASFTNDIHNRIKSFGAYTAGEQQNQSYTRIENNLTIKVPVEQFDNLIKASVVKAAKCCQKRLPLMMWMVK